MRHRYRGGAWLLAVLLGAAWALAPGLRAEEKKADFVGSETCVGCHEAKAAFKTSAHGKYLEAVKKLDYSKACETCHGPGSLHAEAAGDRNNPGFATIKDPSALSKDEQSAACLSCHKGSKKVVFWQTGVHRQQGVSCLSCHSLHEAHAPKQLKAEPVETCLSCHKANRAELQQASHHPLLEGKMTCSGCHNPHGGVYKNLNADSVEETCFKCHADRAGPYAFEHPSVVEDCFVCHKPHGSPNEKLLRQSQPALCLRCHKWPHVNRNNTGGATSAFSANIFEQRGRCTDCHREIHESDRHTTFKN